MSQRQSHQPPPPVPSTLHFAFARCWWRLLLLLRVPRPRTVMRASLWAPWLFPWWRASRWVLRSYLQFLAFLSLAFLPWLLSLLVSRLASWLL